MPKVTELNAIDVVASADLVPVVDASDTTTKKATAEQIRGYKSYVATLTQSSTDAPVATVIENTLGGTVVWARSGAGLYTGTLAGVFTTNKTTVILSLGQVSSFASLGSVGAAYASSTDVITVRTGDATGAAQADGILTQATIEIRVYP